MGEEVRLKSIKSVGKDGSDEIGELLTLRVESDKADDDVTD